MLNYILNSRAILIFILPFALGLFTVFSFQPFNFTIVNFIVLPILFLLISNVNKRSKSRYRKKPYLKNFFYIGYFFGIGFFLSGVYWISYSLTFDESLKAIIPFSLILIPLSLGLFFGVASLISGPFIKNDYRSFFLFCLIYSLTDYFRGKIFSGFPWNLWSYTWSWFTEIIQILNLVGFYAFNSISIVLFCSPVIFFFKTKYKYYFFSFFGLVLFSFFIYGSHKVNSDQKAFAAISEKINVKIISPSFEMRYLENDNQIVETIKKVIRYSDPEATKETLFVWPEGIFAGIYFEDLKKFSKYFKENFSKNHLLVFGINTLDNSTDNFYNSLLITNNNLEIIYKYNKKKLVPFGEFIPYGEKLEKYGLKKVTQGYGSFTKGYSQENFTYNNLNLLPLICYEIIFPHLTQSSEKETNLIVNISEDAWFGSSIGPHQHFAKAIFRSVESNTYVVRSANKGISAFINNNGKIIKRLEPEESGSIELMVPLISNNLKNKNDLIFFVLLFTYLIIFLILRTKTYEK